MKAPDAGCSQSFQQPQTPATSSTVPMSSHRRRAWGWAAGIGFARFGYQACPNQGLEGKGKQENPWLRRYRQQRQASSSSGYRIPAEGHLPGCQGACARAAGEARARKQWPQSHLSGSLSLKARRPSHGIANQRNSWCPHVEEAASKPGDPIGRVGVALLVLRGR